jgi:uncharacterized lipoprotein YajG
MLRLNRSFLAVAVLAVASFALAGCQSMSPSPAATASADKSVIAGGTTFVEVPTGQGQTEIVAYTQPGKMVCPECQAVATKYFQTGVLDESVCKTCGAHLYAGQGELVQPK